MATVTNWVPEIWAARFLSRFEDEVVWVSRANRTYEGEISSAGDTVHIPVSTTSITVKDYVVDANIATGETVSQGSNIDLVVDKQKYYHFYVDDINAAQSRPDIMDEAVGRAARAMAVQVDVTRRPISTLPSRRAARWHKPPRSRTLRALARRSSRRSSS